jgi:predicted HAD superfamily Cof-like phosphohydrolase
MSKDWVQDISDMHQKFGVNEWFEKNKHDEYLMNEYLKFRLNMCLEELLETAEAAGFYLEDNGYDFAITGEGANKDPEEIVDGLIDLSVFAIGTLDTFNVDAHEAWDEVYEANIVKEVGVKEGRPNKWGMPDLIKPSLAEHGFEWQPPSHEGNHGDLPK